MLGQNHNVRDQAYVPCTDHAGSGTAPNDGPPPPAIYRCPRSPVGRDASSARALMPLSIFRSIMKAPGPLMSVQKRVAG